MLSIDTDYSITWDNSTKKYTLTFGQFAGGAIYNSYSSLTFTSNYSTVESSTFADIFTIGDASSGMTSLAASKCAKPTAASRADLISAVAALSQVNYDIELDFNASSHQNIPTSANTVVIPDNVVTDNFSAYTQATGTVTVQKAGLWTITAAGGFEANATGVRIWFIQKISGGVTTLIAESSNNAVNSGRSHFVNIATDEELKVGDEITFQLYQSSGATLSFTRGRIRLSFLHS